jgi:uncharacterized protein YndB with AHSA1/START domain
MAKIQVSSVIMAPVERVWAYIRDFNGLPNWFPGVTDSHIEAGPPVNQPGCVRNFGLPGGARMREQMIELSDNAYYCSYKMLECPLPIQNYTATFRLAARDSNNTEIEFNSQFDAAPGKEKEMVGMLTGIYQGAFELLKKHFGKDERLPTAR